MLLHASLAKTKHNHYRMMGSFQGVDLGEYDDGEGADDLPEEVLAAERAWQERKKQMLVDENAAVKAEMETFGLGYSKG